MLWGAFNNASSAMQAMSWDMGSISQNIANVNTTGYKRKETLFQTVMSESHAAPSSSSGGRLNIFGVQTADRYHIAAQGVVTPSNYANDLAINGSGFFMVAPGDENGGLPNSISTDNSKDVLYTRDGGFRNITGPNDESYFITGSGHYLLGWMADDTGTVLPGGMLEPVYTTPNTIMEGRATTSASIRATLPAEATATPQVYSTTQNVLDGNNATQDVTLTWTRTGGDTWSVAAASPAFNTAPAAWSVTMDGWGNISAPTDTNPLTTLDWLPVNGGPVDRNINIASSAPNFHLEKIYVPTFDDAFQEHSVTLGFERVSANTWFMHVDGGPNSTPGTAMSPVQLNFDGNGQLISPTTSFNGTLSWTSGSAISTATVNFDISNLTQYNGDLYLGGIEQDGYGEGNLLKAGFNEVGEYTGFFTNGEERTLFKVPIAQFVSENRLDPISGNLFRRSAEAGEMTVSAIEDATGEPRFIAGALESSTVNIEDEFTKMIVTQKAYSTNAQVFRTADEMTTVARDLKA